MITENDRVTNRKPPTRYVILDKDGNTQPGTWPTAAHAVCAAMERFPDQSQDPDRTGRGWDVQVVAS